MTAIELTRPEARESVNTGLFERIGALLRAVAGRAAERRDIVKLSRMDARLIRDMGFDPAAIYGAVDGTWDEVARGRFTGYDNP